MNSHGNMTLFDDIETEDVISKSDVFSIEETWVRICVEYGGASQSWFAQVDGNKNIDWISSWPKNTESLLFGVDIQEKTVKDGQRTVSFFHEKKIIAGIFPVLHNNRTVGLLALHSSDSDFFTLPTIRWIETLTEAISASLSQIDKTSQWERVLHINNSILKSSLRSNNDLSHVLGLISDAVHADAVFIYRRPQIKTNRYYLSSSYGFESPMFKDLPFYARADILMKEIQIENLVKKPREQRQNLLVQEGYKTYLSCPLFNDDDVLGVLEVFWRIAQNDEKVLDVIKMIRGTLLWGLTHTEVVNNLVHSNQELMTTHTTALEGLFCLK